MVVTIELRGSSLIAMSLFWYGFKHVHSTSQSENVSLSIPRHLPQHYKSGLSIEEHTNIALSISDLADPQTTTKKWKKR